MYTCIANIGCCLLFCIHNTTLYIVLTLIQPAAAVAATVAARTITLRCSPAWFVYFRLLFFCHPYCSIQAFPLNFQIDISKAKNKIKRKLNCIVPHILRIHKWRTYVSENGCDCIFLFHNKTIHIFKYTGGDGNGERAGRKGLFELNFVQFMQTDLFLFIIFFPSIWFSIRIMFSRHLFGTEFIIVRFCELVCIDLD